MIYLDSSALLKLVLPEAETDVLAAYLAPHGAAARASSELALVEVARALRTAAAVGRLAQGALSETLAAGTVLVRSMELVPVQIAVLQTACRLPTPHLRSLDAVHIASAARYRDELEALVTYDERLRAAAAAEGLPTASPA